MLSRLILVLPNIFLALALIYKFSGGYFINSHIPGPIEYQSKSLHLMRVIALFFGVFYLSVATCGCCMICMLVVGFAAQKKKDTADRVSILSKIKAIPYASKVF